MTSGDYKNNWKEEDLKEEDLKDAKLKEAGEHKQAEKEAFQEEHASYVITMVFSICNNDGH